MAGLTAFLRDLAEITTPTATAALDGYDPDHETTKEKIDFYVDRGDGRAYRLLQIEYNGILGEPWLYRLFTPERVRDAAADTAWDVAEVRYGPAHLYQLALQKDST